MRKIGRFFLRLFGWLRVLFGWIRRVAVKTGRFIQKQYRRLNFTLHINILIIICLGYIYIPVFLFVALWLRPVLAALFCIMMTLAVLMYVLHLLNEIKRTPERVYHGNYLFLLLAVAFLFGIGFVSGWSGHGIQTEDWPKHNAILHDLLERDWPVMYQGESGPSLLTYYIAQYLPPAMIGRLFHLPFQQVLLANWLWSSVGLTLVYLVFVCAAGARGIKRQLTCLAMLIFCGGLMSLQQSVGNSLYPEDILVGQEGWLDYFLSYGRYMLQYRTNFISIRWVFGQTLVPWMVTCIFYMRRHDVRNYLPLLLPVLLSGTFSFVPLAVFAVVAYVCAVIRLRKWKAVLAQTFSPQNLLSATSLGVVLFLYFLGYMIQAKPEEMGVSLVGYGGADFGIYLIFVLGSFVLFTLPILKEHLTNSLFWTAIGLMLALPFIKLGMANDLLMGAGIVTSFVLYLCMAQFLFGHRKEANKTEKSRQRHHVRRGLLIALMLVSFLKPALELYHLHAHDYQYAPNDEWQTLEDFADPEDETIAMDIRYNYYTYEPDDSPFMKYIGKKTTEVTP